MAAVVRTTTLVPAVQLCKVCPVVLAGVAAVSSTHPTVVAPHRLGKVMLVAVRLRAMTVVAAEVGRVPPVL